MGKKNKNKKQADDDWEAEFATATGDAPVGDEPAPAAEEGAAPAAEEAAAPDTAEAPSDDNDTDDEPEVEVKRVLTKKEKEKLKKDKEKAKKAAKKARQKEQVAASAAGDGAAAAGDVAAAGDEATAEPEPEPKSPDPEPESPAPAAEASDDEDEDEDGGNADGDANAPEGETAAEKKKRKKKEREKAKKKAAKAGDKPAAGKKKTAMGSLLKQQLQEQREAEAAALAEQAAKQAALDEEQRLKDEEADAEKARKEEIKRKKREKIEREKAEGKFLTKAQKAKARMAEEKKRQLREAGMLPTTGETGADDGEDVPKPKKVNYGNKKKKKVVVEVVEEVKVEVKVEVAANSEDEIKDEWDASSEEEEPEPEPEPEPVVTKAPTKAEKKAAAAAAEAAAKAEDSEPEDDGTANADYGGVTIGEMRSPICCVLGHVDTGKTKILDKIRKTSVQDGEAGGITQQIGASFFPLEELRKQTSKVKTIKDLEWKVPGLLIMDTPGHESFSNLRNRGSSLCNIAVLVVDIMHGLEPQTIESINLLKSKKTPFIVALNKVDRVHDWKSTPNGPIQASLKKQKEHTKQQFDILVARAKLALTEQGFNCDLYYENQNFKTNVSIVPTSAHTGEGIPDLLYLIVKLTQTVLSEQIIFHNVLNCTVLEVKKIDGHGTTIDVILADGTINEGDRIVLAGLDGPIITTIRSLLMPEPLKELRVKNSYRQFRSVSAANGVKIAAKELDKAVAGMKMHVVQTEEEAEEVAARLDAELGDTLAALKTVDTGVHVQASTLGSLEALLEFLKVSKIPVSGLSIGPVHKKDIVRASIQLERDRKYALLLAFDVPVEKEAEQHAKSLGIKIFTANIIYHLFDAFTKHVEEETARLRAENAAIAIFPCRLKIMPEAIFNTRDPIVMGVVVEEGILRMGTKLTVYKPLLPEKWCDIGVVTSLEFDNKPVEIAHVGQEVCVKIEPMGGDKKLFGRHFDADDEVLSRITRRSIDAVKTYFKEDLKKPDWRLMLKLKKKFEII